MNKMEKAAVVLLFVLLIGWGWLRRPTVQPPAPRGPADRPAPAAPAVPPAAPQALPPAAATRPAPDVGEPAPHAPATLVTLSNAFAEVRLSSHGGCIVSVALRNYRAALDRNSGPLVLDFRSAPALSLKGVPGFSGRSPFEVVSVSATQALFRAVSPLGLRLDRRVWLEERHRLGLEDVVQNVTTQAVALPDSRLLVGPMRLDPVAAAKSGANNGGLGIDTLLEAGGQGVRHWGGGELQKAFGAPAKGFGCSPGDATRLPLRAPPQSVGAPVAWVAVKDRFFAQILTVREGSFDCELLAARDATPGAPLILNEVSAEVLYAGRTLAAGETLPPRSASYYVGPKKHDYVSLLGMRQEEIMEFGWWDWFKAICVLLLNTLNVIHRVLPNYGVAVILLTVLVRVVFWPLTHKSNVSMKKMQQLQPMIQELRKKYEKQPQKMQQAQMALFKEHKVNPMASCLPMLVQIPIFIALFTILRSAVELRYASFLWIGDLSEPEGLFAASLPFGGLNILPLLMTATMAWQQWLTPSTGDPQQQRMMAIMMPGMMLFMFYSMPSGLLLYWTVSQILAIVQLLHQRRGDKGRTPAIAVAKA